MNSVDFLTNQVSVILRTYEVAHSYEGLRSEIHLRVNRGRSFAEIIGGAMANYLIQTQYHPDLINGAIEAAIATIQKESWKKQF